MQPNIITSGHGHLGAQLPGFAALATQESTKMRLLPRATKAESTVVDLHLRLAKMEKRVNEAEAEAKEAKKSVTTTTTTRTDWGQWVWCAFFFFAWSL